MDIKRCHWAANTFDQYVQYHDHEWGVPVHDDKKHFEFIILESAQAGLSWSTILRRREGYRQAFADFEVRKVAEYGPDMVETLMQNPSIIRNRGKIEAAINNARIFIEIQKEFGSFDRYIWGFVDHQVKVGGWSSSRDIPATTPESEALAKDLKRRGFKFFGPTIAYAHMQAVGLVNDHALDCFRYKELIK